MASRPRPPRDGKGGLDTYAAEYMIPSTTRVRQHNHSDTPLTAAHLWLTALAPPHRVVEGHYLV
jgi:hypothetical protein